jgi:hypothetical protein
MVLNPVGFGSENDCCWRGPATICPTRRQSIPPRKSSPQQLVISEVLWHPLRTNFPRCKTFRQNRAVPALKLSPFRRFCSIFMSSEVQVGCSCKRGDWVSWYCGHYWPIVPAPDDMWWWLWRNWWNEDWQGKPKYSENTCPSASLSTTNPTWLDPGWNPGRRARKPATNRYAPCFYRFLAGLTLRLWRWWYVPPKRRAGSRNYTAQEFRKRISLKRTYLYLFALPHKLPCFHSRCVFSLLLFLIILTAISFGL